MPPDLARFAASTANEEGKTLSAVVQDAVRAYRMARLRGEFAEVTGYWSERAREKGILSEEDLERYLRPTECVATRVFLERIKGAGDDLRQRPQF